MPPLLVQRNVTIRQNVFKSFKQTNTILFRRVLDLSSELLIPALNKCGLKEIVQAEDVKPRLQCLMASSSFSMVTVQCEDSGIHWETSSSRCSTPWASEASTTSDVFSLESSGSVPGKVIFIMDEGKFSRKKHRSSSSSGLPRHSSHLKRNADPSKRVPTENVGEAFKQALEKAKENISVTDEPPDTQSHVFSIVSDGSEILNILAPDLISSVDLEASNQMEDKLEYLDENPMLIPKQVCEEADILDDNEEPKVQQVLKNNHNENLKTSVEETVKPLNSDKGTTEVDYFEKFTLIDDRVPIEPDSVKPDLKLETGHATVTTCGPYSENEVAVEDELYLYGHLDESFYGVSKEDGFEEQEFNGNNSNGIQEERTQDIQSPKISLFNEEEGTLEKSLLFPTSYPINPELLEEPPALAFLYKDLYEQAKGVKNKDDYDQSDVESTTSVATFHSRISDDDGTGIYFEKYNLKDEIPVSDTKTYCKINYDLPEVSDDLQPNRHVTPDIDVYNTTSLDNDKPLGSEEFTDIQTRSMIESTYEVMPHYNELPDSTEQENIAPELLNSEIAVTDADRGSIPEISPNDLMRDKGEEIKGQDETALISEATVSPAENNVEIHKPQKEEVVSGIQVEKKLPTIVCDTSKPTLDTSQEKKVLAKASVNDKEKQILKTDFEETGEEKFVNEETAPESAKEAKGLSEIQGEAEFVGEETKLALQTLIEKEEEDLCLQNIEETAESLDYVMVNQDDLPQHEIICKDSQLLEQESEKEYDLITDLEQDAQKELEDLGFEVIEHEKSPADLSEETLQWDIHSMVFPIYRWHKKPAGCGAEFCACFWWPPIYWNFCKKMLVLGVCAVIATYRVLYVIYVFVSCKRNHTENEKFLEEENEKMIQKVTAQRTAKRESFEELKKMKMDYLYDQMVSFQQNVDTAREILEKASKETEEQDLILFLTVIKLTFLHRLLSATESTLSLDKMPSAFSLFEHHAGNSSPGDQKQRHVPVPQTPDLKPQEPNSATSTTITIYWTMNQEDVIDCFQVYCMEEPQGNPLLEEYRVTVKESFLILEDLEPDKCYSVWVMAVNYTGCSLPSDKALFRTAPSSPVIKAEECTVCWDTAIVRWNTAHPESTESFTLEWCKQYPSEGEGLRSVAGIRDQQLKVTLQPNENYFFYVRAANVAGSSEQSEAALISTKGTRFHLLRDTAHPVLELSPDGTDISISEIPLVLGEVLPASGCHYWEMTVAGCKGYSIGATFQPSQEEYDLEQDSTSWCMQCCSTSTSYSYKFLHNEVFSEVRLTEPPDRIGILLDYRTGRLSFYNVPKRQVLYTFRNRFQEASHPTFALETPGNLYLHTGIELPPFAKQS
uniref:Cardiomyopathy-associated protein 5 n=1 Tax=Xenopus tropicalis TaxID=8364 RepID=A0A6I8QBS4_XENTR